VGQVDSASPKPQFGKKFGGLHGMSNSAKVFDPSQDSPMEFDLKLTLEELYGGCLKKIKVTRKVLNHDGMTTSAADKIMTIKVTPGWKAATKVIFAKEGDQGPNKIPGGFHPLTPADIVFKVVPQKHARFGRDGDNLKMHSQVPLLKALVGYSLEVQTLDDRLLRIPVNETITYGNCPSFVDLITSKL
jgi:DnaJ family protein B protein 13